jgi:hypothetical protein
MGMTEVEFVCVCARDYVCMRVRWVSRSGRVSGVLVVRVTKDWEAEATIFSMVVMAGGE